MNERRTLRQISAALLNNEDPPPAIDGEEAQQQRARARASLAEARDRLRRIEAKERA